MDDERGPSGLKQTIRDPFQYTRDNSNLSADQFKAPAPKRAPVDDFPPLSDEEYGQMEDEYNRRQQNGEAMAKRVSGMKREAHKPPPKPPSRVQVAQRRSSLIGKMARNARGRKRW